MTIGEKVRKYRLLIGYSQENVADMLHLSTSAYGDIERNKTELTIQRAEQLAKILKVSLSELLEIKNGSEDTLLELLKLENEKLKIEVEKSVIEAAYWKEKFESLIFRINTASSTQPERKAIGF